MPKYDVFLSHNSQDKPAVEELARRLVEAGIQPWLDKWNLIPGEPWQEAIEEALDSCATCAVFVGPSGTGPWQNEEMRAAIQRRVDERPFRVIPVLLPGAERGERGRLPSFLVAATWVEFRRTLDDEEAFHRLTCGIRGVEPGLGPGQAIYEGECPYRGLMFFDVEHAPFFFGREALTEWLLAELRGDNRFLAIIGPSGSGKSSLARAGLVAALKRGDIEGSDQWPIAICRPGPNPLESLAVALTPYTSDDPLDLVDKLHDERRLHITTRLALHDAPPELRLVLMVDQFEEVFTLCSDEGLRQALVDNLLYATGVAEGQTVVLLTVRADFYGRCATYPALAAALSDHQILVGLMTDDELRRAIERPAQLAGCEFEAGLVEMLLRDVRDQPGGLPLLQHALLELWVRREGRRLTLPTYDAIGRATGALERQAEEVYKGFTKAEKRVCQHIFLRLTQPGQGTKDTKRRATFEELLPEEGSGRETVRVVIQALASEDARLITTEGEGTSGNGCFVEVAHEALIQCWSRLREWIEDNREALRIHQRLTEAAQEWKEHERDDGYLYRGTRLDKVEQWKRTYTLKLSALEHDFLIASIAARRAEIAARRQRQMLRFAVFGLSVLVGITLVALLWMGVTGTGLFEGAGEWIRGRGLEASVNAIAVEPRDDTVIYAGTEDRRVLKSSDQGSTWETVLETEEEVQSLAVSPNEPGTLYAGTKEGHLLCSIDSGINWAQVGKVLDAEEVNDLLVDPVEPEILYACDAAFSCYQSPNEGANWVAMSKTSNVSTIAVAATEEDKTVLYLGTRDGRLLRSTDRGETWQQDPEQKALDYITDIAVSHEDTDLVYVGTIRGLYRFQMKNGHFDVQPMDEDLELATVAVIIDPLALNVVFASVLNGNVYLVQQRGDSFQNEIVATGHDFPGSIATRYLVAGDHNPFFLFAATEKGVFAWKPSRRQENTWFDRQ